MQSSESLKEEGKTWKPSWKRQDSYHHHHQGENIHAVGEFFVIFIINPQLNVDKCYNIIK